MGRRRRRAPSRDETAAAIEAVAERVEARDFSFDVQLSVQTAQEGLLELMDVDASLLLSRVSLMLLTENGTMDKKYDFVRERVESTPPLNPAEDGETLRSLAARVRAGP